MIKLSFVCVSVAMLAGLAGPVGAQTQCSASLDGDQQNPPVPTTASGTASLTLNAAQDTLTYDITIVGLDLPVPVGREQGGTPVIAAHFHSAPAGQNGPVVFGLIGPNNDPDDLVIDPVAGTLMGAWEDTDMPPLNPQLGNLLADGLYLNFHTPNNPGGEIRGQILCGGVPTVGPVGLWVLTLLLLSAGGFMLWRRASI